MQTPDKIKAAIASTQREIRDRQKLGQPTAELFEKLLELKKEKTTVQNP